MILITQPRAGSSHNEIIALQMTAREMGWDVFPAPTSWRMTDEFIATKPVGVPYGSQIFCETICQQLDWGLIANPFDWLASVPPAFLKRKVEFMTLVEAKKNTERKFIKPADDKCFDAKVYEIGEFNPPPVLPDEIPVLVSDVVKFTEEYRCVVRDNKVVTHSCYVLGDEICNPKNYHISEAPAAFLNSLLEVYKSENAVIDVGIMEQGFAVIETNPIWASGIYGGDSTEILKTMETTCYRSIEWAELKK